MPRERTIELTNYCPFECSFCSSDSVTNSCDTEFMGLFTVFTELDDAKRAGVQIVHLSGGEPMFHDRIGRILSKARKLFGGRNVILHTNMIENIAYNARVIDGVRVHAYLPVMPGTDEVHAVKRVEQGREARQPKIHCSANWREQCEGTCDHVVIRPDGSHAKTPCRKWESIE